MTNPNPFVPKGSLLDLQNKRRTHMKFGVLCVLTVSVAGLMIMLIQGCKQKTDTSASDMPTVPPPDTNVTVADTNPPTTPTDLSNPPPVAPGVPGTNPVTATAPVNPPAMIQVAPPVAPVAVTPPPTPTTPPDASGEYTVVKGDSPAKIAKKNGVTLKALMAANPGLKPTKLKIGQKLVIPTGGKTVAEATPAAGTEPTDTAEESYTVKSGDTLTKIAKAHHVKVKSLMAANGLTTTQIKVGKKLKIPMKAGAAPVAAPVSTDTTSSAPPIPAINTTPVTSSPVAPAQH